MIKEKYPGLPAGKGKARLSALSGTLLVLFRYKIHVEYKGDPAREARREDSLWHSIGNTKEIQRRPGARNAPGNFDGIDKSDTMYLARRLGDKRKGISERITLFYVPHPVVS